MISNIRNTRLWGFTKVSELFDDLHQACSLISLNNTVRVSVLAMMSASVAEFFYFYYLSTGGCLIVFGRFFVCFACLFVCLFFLHSIITFRAFRFGSSSNSSNSLIYMEIFENGALQLARNPLSLWYRYMDDTFTLLHEPIKVNKYVTYGFTS